MIIVLHKLIRRPQKEVAMKRINNSASLYLFQSTVLCFLLCSVASAQDRNTASRRPSSDDQVLQALLKEVRLMRISLERATSANLDSYRAQILVERLRIQQEHVDRLARQLDAVRNDLAEMATARRQLAERSKELEEIIRAGGDAEQTKQAENELRDLKYAMEQQREKEQTRHDQEGKWNAELQTEQAKLADLNSQLDRLERKLESTETPATGSRP
jgi:chromosome segregation ATPase